MSILAATPAQFYQYYYVWGSWVSWSIFFAFLRPLWGCTTRRLVRRWSLWQNQTARTCINLSWIQLRERQSLTPCPAPMHCIWWWEMLLWRIQSCGMWYGSIINMGYLYLDQCFNDVKHCTCLRSWLIFKYISNFPYRLILFSSSLRKRLHQLFSPRICMFPNQRSR